MALLGCVFIAGATFIAYSPAIKGEFLWDDTKYVVNNELLSAPDGLRRIWFSTDVPSQYFPLVYTTLRFEHQLWGLNPIPYHVNNIALHVISALLVWLILRRLSMPAAFLSAAAFALHPINVESVAWITQRKNTLMLVFALLSILFYIEVVLREQSRRKAVLFYLLSIFCYVLSLLSKTTACVVPLVLFLILWLKGISFNARRILEIVPYFVLGVAMGLLTMWWEHHRQGVALIDLGLTFLDKVLIATRGLWFYAGKILWPVNLSFSYPRWEINANDPAQYIWMFGCLLVAGVLWFFRKGVGRGVIAGIIFFVITLLPMLGFFQLYTFIYTWAADHYAYMATIGLIAIVMAGGLKLTEKYAKAIGPIAAGVVLVLLGILTWGRAGLFARPELIWRDTLQKDPNSWLAHNNLGRICLVQGKLDEAIFHITRSLELGKDAPVSHPHDIVAAHFNLGLVYREQKKYEEAIEQFRQAAALAPNDAEAHYELGDLLEKQGRLEEAAEQFSEAIGIDPNVAMLHYRLGIVLESQGNIVKAVEQYQRALDIEPAYVDALNKLVGVCALRQDYELIMQAKAVEYGKRAVEATGRQNPVVLNLWAMAYASEHKYEDAIPIAQEAMEKASAAGANELADFIRSQIDDYAELMK
ncbi:MAG: tetratricopeptide repeat protein [Sedimentisphaerales bacterium]|nr:tetratricopeptide repeat protein [Sedimentisphaerales bacterium]